MFLSLPGVRTAMAEGARDKTSTVSCTVTHLYQEHINVQIS